VSAPVRLGLNWLLPHTASHLVACSGCTRTAHPCWLLFGLHPHHALLLVLARTAAGSCHSAIT
jgi:hypothetical protein